MNNNNNNNPGDPYQNTNWSPQPPPNGQYQQQRPNQVSYTLRDASLMRAWKAGARCVLACAAGAERAKTRP